MRLTTSSALFLALSAAPPRAPARVPATRIDWASFLGRHNMVWERLPRRWGESAFIGNGRIGAAIALENGALGWTINRTDVVHDGSRYPIGRVVIKTAGAPTGGTATLSLWNAEAAGTLVTDRGEIRWRSFVARDPGVIAISLDARGGERSAQLDWAPAEARPPRKIYQAAALAPEDLHPPPVIVHGAGDITSVQSFIGGDAHAEVIHAVPGRGANGTKVYYVAIGYGKMDSTAFADARSSAGAAAAQGLSRLSTNHRAWWHDYYAKSFLTFPDERLEGYYWIQIYKLGAAMRADGPILDLNGPWFNTTPWPAIWWNLNIQLTYSPLFKANRLDLAESLFRNLDRGRQALIDNVPTSMRPDAAAIGRSSGPDLHRTVDLANANSDAAHEMGDLPWAMFYYWEHYRYQMDDRLLRERVYPLLRLAINNYLPYLQKGADGVYHLPPTLSPELAVVPDANYDLALLRWGLQSLIATADRLRIDEPNLARWRDVLANLTPFPADSTGLWVGRDRPWQQSHRHYSHLLAIYPLGLITPDVPAQRAVIEASLRSWEREPGLFRGYSFTGGGSMHAMLGQGDTVLSRLNAYLDFPKYMEPNTFYAEAGPVIETPLSAAATIQEMFLQDWGAAVRVFPAMPSPWRDASFADLRADGAFLVSGVRRDARTAWVRVHSLAGQPLRVVVADWDDALVIAHEGPASRVQRVAAGVFAIALAKGATITLAPGAAGALPEVAPVVQSSVRRSWPALHVDSSASPDSP